MPTRPPGCSLTHVAPPTALTSALSSGQSAIASEPSFIPSVSRLGLATEPASRGARPVAIGAADEARRRHFAAAHQLVETKACPGAFAVAEPADACRKSLERHLLLRHADPPVQADVLREELQD